MKNLPTDIEETKEEIKIFEKENSFQKICAWCLIVLPGHNENAKKISHGICQTCAHNYLKESGLENCSR